MSDANALLESVARLNLRSVPRDKVNKFIPDANHLFHTLGICDQLMSSCEQFTSNTFNWIPIVSHIYVSVLWLYQILKVYSDSGYGILYADTLRFLDETLRIKECPVPGPLVPFFQAISSVSGATEFVGDTTPYVPDFYDLWSQDFHVRYQYARSIPIPAILLDQLHRFATWPIPDGENLYDNFLWYDNIFEQAAGAHSNLHHLGPQTTASLHTTEELLINAREFWNDALAHGITRTSAEDIPFDSPLQLFGFKSQADRTQINWFQTITETMQDYCNHFSQTKPLGSISTIGIGSVLVYGTTVNSTAMRNWIYPDADGIASFPTAIIEAPRPIVNTMVFRFLHADHLIESQAEQYGITTHTNIIWGSNAQTQHNWNQLVMDDTHTGNYWRIPFFRASFGADIASQYASIITEALYLPDTGNEV